MLTKKLSYRAILVITSLPVLAGSWVWLRLQGPTNHATRFVNAINTRDYATAGDFLEPLQQPLPDTWAHPQHWGDDGALSADAYLAPVHLSDVITGVRHVVASVHLDAESYHGTQIFPHEYIVTASSVTRIPKKPDNVLYPVTIRQESKEPVLEIPTDVTDVPAMDLRIMDDASKRYFLIGNIESPSPRSDGRRVLIVLPGGDGSADFSPFVRRIYKMALNDEWIVAQIVAPRWARRQAIVWPTKTRLLPEARFSTEQLIDSVIDDITTRGSIDPTEIYVLAWSSSGPAAYSVALMDKPRIAGAFIAMSVFRENEYSKPVTAPSCCVYLMQSPDDNRTPFRHAESAQQFMESVGIRVMLKQYKGGHGWHGNPFEMVSEGMNWLVMQNGNAASQTVESGTGQRSASPDARNASVSLDSGNVP